MGLSQAALGREIGLADEVASARINRYERGVHEPDLRTADAVAKALGVPLSWLVCTDPKLAAMIDGFAKLPPKAQDALLAMVETALARTKKPSAAQAKKVPVKPRAAKTAASPLGASKAPAVARKAKRPKA